MDQSARHRLKGYGINESAVRIEAQDGKIQGAGVALTPRHIATCTHVLLDTLSLARDRMPPQAEITLTVWRSGGGESLRAKVMPDAFPVARGDFALLELDASHADLLPACVVCITDWQGAEFVAYGYPDNFDAGQGVQLEGLIPIGDGRIQCNPNREGISRGYSGGPVYSNGDLVGIAQSRRRFNDPELKYDYIIPISRLLASFPDLASVRRQPWFSLACELFNDRGTPDPHLLHEVGGASPHTMAEYRLQRIARDWDTRDIRLDFTPLKMLLEERRRDTEYGEGPKPKALENLREALAEPHPVFLLKGAPGGGKTTLLKRLAFDLASDREHSRSLPIFIELAGHRGDTPPAEWLAKLWQENFADMPSLTEVSRENQILWLLDGLNELPDEAAARRLDKITAWAAWLGNQANRHRAIISCRSADYLDELDQVDGHVVPHLELQTLDQDKISEFLHNRTRLDPTQAQAAVGYIKRRDLVSLYNTPLMLTLLETVLTPTGNFPDGRADLFGRYLCKLLVKERDKQPALLDRLFEREDLQDMLDAPRQPELPQSAPFIAALSAVAYAGQKREITGERQEVSFDRRTVKKELGDDRWRLAWSINALVAGESRRKCRFRHQQFQEFFAALKLAETGEVPLATAPCRPEDFNHGLDRVRQAMKPWQQLPGVDRSGWEETALMAAELADDGDGFVSELAQVNLPLAGQCAALESVALTIRSRLAEQLLARMRDPGADLRVRIAAGHALGDMGMLEVLGYEPLLQNGERVAWLPPTEKLAAGDYTFGSEGDPEAYDDEHRFTGTLKSFQLGRFPVTHAEWEHFKRADGYKEARWWQGKASESYRRNGSNEGQIYTWEFWREQQASGRLEAQLETTSFDEETRDLVRQKTALDENAWQAHIANLRKNSEQVTEPAFWRSARYSNPLQPVVGVSLFEVLAYCRWLSELSGKAYHLPHELQWEAAARGSGRHPRRFAFGDQLLPDCCNIRDESCMVGAPTPVGLYKTGKTPQTGLYDMTGNVWEWTASTWRDNQPYDTNPLDKLEDASQRRVVRGGSWSSVQRLARAAVRNRNLPDDRNYDLGCRVLCGSPLES